ncbi:hypothetical protein RchiOBHm_Chr5g0033001 [Rosa chinensis]|uniref:Uncharacterized protein n=1 Tax=Rosa chinensis TaxID=74649 RepID=A0A2P6QAK4_ROSCH|nr:hypothetical protein RchiOBHm_Chr5g0033001 [Rosa chinensis]
MASPTDSIPTPNSGIIRQASFLLIVIEDLRWKPVGQFESKEGEAMKFLFQCPCCSCFCFMKPKKGRAKVKATAKEAAKEEKKVEEKKEEKKE